MTERQTNYTIGEGMELPSKGKIYGKDKINSHVELRSMTARDEMKRLAPSTSQFKVLADIIEGCMIEKPNMHVYDLALGDYEYLLHRLRIVTYGDAYKIVLRCPYCGEEIETIAHLEELEIKDFDFTKFEEARTITLPRSGHTVTLKFQTPRMLDEVENKTKEMRRKYKNADISFDLFILLSTVIDTVDGAKLDAIKLEGFINKLPALDMTKIVNSIDTLNSLIGIDNKLVVDCPKCGGEVHTSFRFGSEFFRPTTI
jgi:predicted RNA-binding Zn-ribbon protein involved in translation (DUF1610 family)